jgi:hypothetical protein
MLAPIVSEFFKPRIPEPSWAWADRCINFNRAANYDTPYKGRFDSSLMPFWKEPLEMARARDVRVLRRRRMAVSRYSERQQSEAPLRMFARKRLTNSTQRAVSIEEMEQVCKLKGQTKKTRIK